MPAKGQHWLFDFEKRADADDVCTAMIGMGLAHITLRGRTEVRAKTLPNGVRVFRVTLRTTTAISNAVLNAHRTFCEGFVTARHMDRPEK